MCSFILATLKSKEESVAFFVYLTNDIVDPPDGQTLIFNGVETNIGNAYDRNHGVFAAPKNGTYHFAFLASTPTGSADHSIHLFMKKNEEKTKCTYSWMRIQTIGCSVGLLQSCI